MMSAASEKFIREATASDAVRDAGLQTPENIVRFDDICYGEDTKWQKLDVYRPREAGDSVLPVIVSVHGGGWVYGDKELYQYYCMDLAQRGFAVVNFTYRLAPQYKYPAPLEDTNLVFQWMRENSEKYGLDTERIFGVGDSAGGNILGLYAAIWTNPEYAKAYEFKVPEGMNLRAVALNCGAFCMDIATEQTNELMTDYLPEKGTPEELRLISVPNWITEHYPPTFLMTAVGDFLKYQAPYMVKTYMEHDVPFLYRFYGSRDNQLGHVFHCAIRTEDAKLCNDEECEFFRKYC